MGMTVLFLSSASIAASADGEGRRVSSKVSPIYPDLAKRAKIVGMVRLEATIAPNGTVKHVKALGGHPLLVEAAMDAIKKWRYVPASEESVTVVEFRFDGPVS
jgi:protein TonB